MYLNRLHALIEQCRLMIEGDGDQGSGGDGGQGGASDHEGASDNGGQSLSGALGGSEGDAGSGTPQNWPDDWRDRMAGGDEGFSKLLKRFASPENFAKAYTGLQKKLGTAQQAPTLGDNPSAEEVAAYRKAMGIPEAPDGYALAFPEGVTPSEADTEQLGAFAKFMHDRHIPPAAVKAAFAWYNHSRALAVEAQAAAANEARIEAHIELRKEYGADLKRNLGLADELLEEFPGLAGLIDPARPNAAVVRDLVRLARERADEEALIGGDGQGGGKSLEDEKAELLAKQFAGKLSKADDARLNQIFEALAAKDARQGRQRAAA